MAGEKQTKEEDIKWGEDGHLSRFDCGLNLGFGIEYKVLQFNANYAYGLFDMSPNENDLSLYNRAFSLSIAYVFTK